MKCSALILTGGSGNRIKNINFPKQFYELLGKPIFVHALDVYEEIDEINDIYLVTNQNYSDRYNAILSKYSFKKLKKLVPGGATRQDSVDNGLSAIEDTDIVVLQDGVNPTTYPELVKNCIKAAQIHGASTAVKPAYHTVLTAANNEVKSVLERDTLVYACAPQAYRFKLIIEALKYAHKNHLANRPTVDLIKRIGHKVALVPSELESIKVTTYENLATVKQILKKRKTSKKKEKIPKVSVIICTYNRAQYICEAIDSVLAQTYKDYELIIIDDGSSDNTKTILDDKYAGRLRYIYRANGGLPSARNLGIRLAQGKYIAFLDADDMWLPNKLEKQVKVIEQTDAGLVYTAKYMMDADGNLTGDVRPHQPARNMFDLLNGCYISMSVLVKKDIMEKAGMFDESISHANDTDLWIRVAKISKIKFIEQPLIKYRLHSNNMSHNREKKYENHTKILKKALKDKKIKVPRSILTTRLAKEYYLLGKEQYLKGKYKDALHSLLAAFKNDKFLFRHFITKQDALLLKIKKICNPFAALLVYTSNALWNAQLSRAVKKN